MEILGRHCCSNLIPCVKDCIQEVLFAVQDIRPKKSGGGVRLEYYKQVPMCNYTGKLERFQNQALKSKS